MRTGPEIPRQTHHNDTTTAKEGMTNREVRMMNEESRLQPQISQIPGVTTAEHADCGNMGAAPGFSKDRLRPEQQKFSARLEPGAVFPVLSVLSAVSS